MAKKAGADYGELLMTNYDPRPYLAQQSLFSQGSGLTLSHIPSGGELRAKNLAAA